MSRSSKVAIVVCMLAATGCIAGYVLWQRATALPEWAEAEVARPRSRGPEPAGPASWQPDGEGQRYVLQGFHRGQAGLERGAVRASRAVLEGDHLEVGVVLDLRELDRAQMSDNDRRLYEAAADTFTWLRREHVYVGLEDEPVRSGGRLQLGPHPTVRIGTLRTTLDSAADKLGTSEAALRHALNRQLQQLGFEDPVQQD